MLDTVDTDVAMPAMVGMDSDTETMVDTDLDSAERDLPMPNLNLLLRFQRLLFAQLYPPEGREEGGDYERDLPGALSLLRKYVQMLSHHIVEVLPQATGIQFNREYFSLKNHFKIHLRFGLRFSTLKNL